MLVVRTEARVPQRGTQASPPDNQCPNPITQFRGSLLVCAMVLTGLRQSHAMTGGHQRESEKEQENDTHLDLFLAR